MPSKESQLTMFLVCTEAYERYAALAIKLELQLTSAQKKHATESSVDLAVRIEGLKADLEKASSMRDRFKKKMSGKLTARKRGGT